MTGRVRVGLTDPAVAGPPRISTASDARLTLIGTGRDSGSGANNPDFQSVARFGTCRAPVDAGVAFLPIGHEERSIPNLSVCLVEADPCT